MYYIRRHVISICPIPVNVNFDHVVKMHLPDFSTVNYY